MSEQTAPKESPLCVGDRVTLQLPLRIVSAKVRRVYQSGSVELDFTGPLPHPFFRGPYRSCELELAQ